MLGLISSLRSITKIPKTTIDNKIFRLHHTVTVFILLVFVIILTTVQFTGVPIDCINTVKLPPGMLNTYCWMHTTYTNPTAYNKEVGVDIPHFGLDATSDEKTFKFHTYYQWVVFLLLFQAAMFYAPYWWWHMWEGGKMKNLVMDLRIGLVSQDVWEQNENLLVDYFMSSWSTHDWYAIKFVVCEIFCVLNVLAQTFITNIFLNGEFFTYGLKVIAYMNGKSPDGLDPKIKMFPRITKCMYMQFGKGGTIEKTGVICVMASNIINEKIYIFLWFWFLFLIVVTFAQLLVHVLIFSTPVARVQLLCQSYGFERKRYIVNLVNEASFGDWFLIYMLGKNMDCFIFQDLVYEIAERIDEDVHLRDQWGWKEDEDEESGSKVKDKEDKDKKKPDKQKGKKEKESGGGKDKKEEEKGKKDEKEEKRGEKEEKEKKDEKDQKEEEKGGKDEKEEEEGEKDKKEEVKEENEKGEEKDKTDEKKTKFAWFS